MVKRNNFITVARFTGVLTEETYRESREAVTRTKSKFNDLVLKNILSKFLFKKFIYLFATKVNKPPFIQVFLFQFRPRGLKLAKYFQ